MKLAPTHIRAARALLAWSQKNLAEAAGVATSTIADFERGKRTPIANNLQSIRDAMERAGIRFLLTGAVVGPPIPGMTAAERPITPIRWVSAEDLSVWANRTDGAVSLPTLVAFLIRATHTWDIRLRFPADEGTRYAGWDGTTSSESESAYVPRGEAGWEIGSQRSQICRKATEDYQKRTAKPDQIDPADAAFIFITPRHWPKKDEWAKVCQDEGVWREVRAYDANDLVHWIEQAPAVGLWLASRLNQRPAGIRELDEIWEEWSLATEWPLTEDLILSDRDEDAARILRWLRNAPSVFSLQATTTDEAVAFFHAALCMLPKDIAAEYRSRCLVATTATSARMLKNATAPLIVLLTEPEPGLARALKEHGHFVLQAYDDRQIPPGEVCKLSRPSREGIASALITTGITAPRAEALARDSARNLAILRRLIPNAPGRLPQWAQDTPPHALLAALLAGGWDEKSDADRARLAEIADQSYESVIDALTTFVGNFDSPLQKVGSTWRIASPADAWLLLAPYVTKSYISRFEAAAHAVLGSADPRFEIDPEERWMAAFHGVHREYSQMLRHGIGSTLILLALWGEKAHTVPDAGRRADAVVEKLLRNADSQRWWSLSRDFRLLAEASPSAFLNALEDSLDETNDTPIRALFESDKGHFFGGEYLSDLLWALESLAWSTELLPRVTHVLARLEDIDDRPRHYANSPANSLRSVHLLWNPQTFATLDERLRALDLIRKYESDAAWKLMLGILPGDRDMVTPSPIPLWRDFTVDKVESATWKLMARGATQISERLLADVGVNAARWENLLDRLADLTPGPDAGLAKLDEAEPRITGKADRTQLWTKLRRVLHHHRQFPDAEWSLPVEVLDRVEAIYERFAPSDPLGRSAWLFESSIVLPRPSPGGWDAEQHDVDAARRDAATALFEQGGTTSILSLARLVDSAGYIGKALYDDGLPEFELDELLKVALQSDNPNERDLAHGLIVSAVRCRKESWALALIAQAKREDWGGTALLTILRALPLQRWTWEQVEDVGGEIHDNYWRRAPVIRVSDNSDDVVFAIQKLILVGRARNALPLAGHRDAAKLPSDVLVEVLQEAAIQPYENDGDPNEATMFQYYVAEILQVLDGRSDVDDDALIAIEWSYLPVLEHSRRPPTVLLEALSKQPDLFIQMLSAVFKANDESGIVEVEPENPERARAVAHQAFRLLELWDHIPGTREDGSIDSEILEAWIKEARLIANTKGRGGVADSRIGNMLSASSFGADGNWPAEAVRDALDLFRSKPMIEGFQAGTRNRRGVTSRMPRDGGILERKEVDKYRSWAMATTYEHRHTSKALHALADSYEEEARRHDEEAERVDWEY